MDLSGVIESFLTGIYTVTRTQPATFTDGRAVSGSTSTFTTRACIQPASGRQLKELPEGSRSDEAVAIYSESELLTVGATQEADTLVYRGEVWQVQNVKRWDELGNYWLGVATKVARQ
jgi:hypothetical protein